MVMPVLPGGHTLPSVEGRIALRGRGHRRHRQERRALRRGGDAAAGDLSAPDRAARAGARHVGLGVLRPHRPGPRHGRARDVRAGAERQRRGRIPSASIDSRLSESARGAADHGSELRRRSDAARVHRAGREPERSASSSSPSSATPAGRSGSAVPSRRPARGPVRATGWAMPSTCRWSRSRPGATSCASRHAPARRRRPVAREVAFDVTPRSR